MLQFCGLYKFQFDQKSNHKNSFGNPINSPPMNSTFNASSILSFSSYYLQTILITNDGSMMAIGNNTKGIINGSFPREIIQNFTKFEIKNQEGKPLFPISAVCGESYSLYLLSTSKESRKTYLAYTYSGLKSDSPIFLNIGDVNPIALFGGFSHSAAIDDKGSIIFIPKSIFKMPTALIESTSLPNDEKAVSIAYLWLD